MRRKKEDLTCDASSDFRLGAARLGLLTPHFSLLTAVKNLHRHPLRTALSLLGIAVTSAMLLDMVMLGGGIERSFERLLLGRGYQIRISPKGTLPFDTEASIPHVSGLLARLRDDPDVKAAAPLLGASVYARNADALVTLVGYGIDPSAQSMYQLQSGADLAPGDTTGLLLSEPAAAAIGARRGDTVVLFGRLDPQVAAAAVERRLVARGVVRWLYDYRGQLSVGAALTVIQALSGQRAEDRASALAVRLRDGVDVERAAARFSAGFPQLEVNSVADLVASFRERLIYFRQLSYILGTISLFVTLLLVATLLTITVNERLGEIATLRAIGVSRAHIVAQVMVEGTLLTVIGGAVGVGLGLTTAHYLDAILTSFPGLPAAISFFVPQAPNLALAGALLLATGSLAGCYPAWLAARAPVAATLRAEAT